MGTLFKNFDSSKLEKVEYPNEGLIEITDKMNKRGERGIFKFDKNKVLRLYAFLINKNLDAIFTIEYDSLGNQITSTGSDVVQWYIRPLNEDTISLTFLLCRLNYSYDKIIVEAKKYKKNTPLFESAFAGLVGSTINIPTKGVEKIYVSGLKQNKCSKEIKSFKDSTYMLPLK